MLTSLEINAVTKGEMLLLAIWYIRKYTVTDEAAWYWIRLSVHQGQIYPFWLSATLWNLSLLHYLLNPPLLDRTNCPFHPASCCAQWPACHLGRPTILQRILTQCSVQHPLYPTVSHTLLFNFIYTPLFPSMATHCGLHLSNFFHFTSRQPSEEGETKHLSLAQSHPANLHVRGLM